MRIFIFLSLTVLLALATTKTAFSENRYWVNGSGNWNDPQQWSETSGGAPGATVPTKEDHVIFDHNSFTSNNQTVIIKEVVYCNDFRWEVDNYQPTLKSSSFIFKKWTKAAIQVHGSLIINENVNHAFFGDIVLKNSNEKKSISVSESLNSDIIIEGKGSWILENHLKTTKNIVLVEGTLIANKNVIECDQFISSGNQKKYLNLESSSVYFSKLNLDEGKNLNIQKDFTSFISSQPITNKNIKTGEIEFHNITYASNKEAKSITFDLEVDSVSCFDGSNGNIRIYNVSGTPNFKYQLWDGPTWESSNNIITQSDFISNTEYIFSGLEAHPYYIQIIDQEGSASQLAPVYEPDEFIGDSIGINQGLSCYNSSDAEFEAYASGGTEPYSYQWVKYNGASWDTITTNDPSHKILTGAPIGWYKVLIKDKYNCGNPPYAEIELYFLPGYGYDDYIPNEIVITGVNYTNSCTTPNNTGTISISGSGGTGALTYAIVRTSDNDSTTNSTGVFENLVADTYRIYVIDANGCVKQGSDITIIQLENPTASILPDNPTVCPNSTIELDGNPTLSPDGSSIDSHEWTGDISYLDLTDIQKPDFTGSSIGTFNLTYTVTDNNGCTGSDDVTLTVEDVTVPTAECKDISVTLDNTGSVTINGNDIDNGSIDNCTDPANLMFTVTPNSFDCSDLGDNPVILTVTDEQGNSSTCTATVTVEDNIAPTLICPGNVVQDNDAGVCTAEVYGLTPTTDDNCGVVLQTWTMSGATSGSSPATGIHDISGTDFNSGVTTVTYRVEDLSGNFNECSFTVTINDTEDPTISCPSDVSVNTSDDGTGDCSTTATLGTPTTDDNCGVNSVIAQVGGTTIDPLTYQFTTGITTVTWIVEDNAGNTASCTQEVEVIDDEDPTISCPADVTVNTSDDGTGDCSTTAALGTPTTDDNCGVNSVIAQVGGSTIDPLTYVFPVGVTTVTWIVEDDAGNTASCTQEVTVEDDENPTITCPADVTINTSDDGTGDCSTTAALGMPTTDDNCGLNSVVAQVGGTTINPATYLFPVGLTMVTWIVEDDAGNTASCTQNVTVVDDEDPTISCPGDLTVYTSDDGTGNCSTTAALGTPITNDNCGVNNVIAQVGGTTIDPLTYVFPIGITTVTWIVEDDAGNTANCNQNVTVEDDENPVAVCNDIIVALDNTGNATITSNDIDGGSSDNCGISTIIASQTSFNCGDLGDNPVILTVTDEQGNSSTCTATVTVEDNIAPTLICPGNVVQDNDAGVCTAEVYGLTPTTDDNCGVVLQTWTMSGATSGSSPATGIHDISGTDFNSGVTTVTYRVEDLSGNFNECSFTVTINDTEDPTISCPSDVSVNTSDDGTGDCSTTATLGTPTTDDNCGVNSVIAQVGGTTIDPLTYQFTTGITTVTWIVEDNAGNTASCTQEVEVIDDEDPTISCPADVTVNTSDDGTGDCSTTAALGTPTTDDNCGVNSVIAQVGGSTIDPLTYVFPVGVTTVTWIVEDDAGNTASCTQEVTVEDDENPMISCPNDTTVIQDGGGSCNAAVNNLTPTTDDNCGVVLQTWTMTGATTNSSPGSGINDVSGEIFEIGVTTVEYTIEDASGNSAICSFTVEIYDEVDGGSIQADQNICYNTLPAELTNVVSASVCGGYTYQWQKKTGAGGWSDIPGATDENYQEINPLTETTYYTRRAISDLGFGTANSDTVTITITPAPTVFAGEDTTLCYGDEYHILDADTSNTSAIEWSTVDGDGSFDNEYIIDPIYTPGSNDLLKGFVDLVLTSYNNTPCNDVTDTMRINYLPELLVTIGKPSPFYIDSTSTHIDVYFDIEDHRFIGDLALYLVSPLDSVVQLKTYCEGLPLALNDLEANFYNDPLDTSALADITINACNPISARYEFLGDWKKKLHGQDPANGAWRVRIGDNRNITGSDGFLKEARLKFTDFNNKGILESIIYVDSTINFPINESTGGGNIAYTDLNLSLTGLTTSCYGLCDATAVGTASGGQPPYVSYEWSDVPDFSNIIATTDTVDLCAGTFYLRITDSHGCSAIDSVNVGSPPEIIIDSDTVVHNTCYGYTDGKIALAFSGGTGALQYTHNGTDWYNSGDTIENLAAEEYLVTIIDANQCTKDTLITILEPDPILISTTWSDISCYNSADGQIEITAVGGTDPYEFSIDSAQTWQLSNTFSGLASDTFYVAVQDQLGCIQFGDTVYMNNPDSIAIDSVNVTHVACDGSATDGEIVVYAHGGTGDLEYSINSGADYFSDSLFTGLNGGDYQIVVRDENGCTKFLDSLVTINGPIIITDETIVHNSCYGYADGEITLTFTGGTGLLQYSINGMDWFNSGETIENLPADTYNVIIQDATGCAINYEITINQPDPINIVTSYTDITCNGYADGEIQITATEGTSPYEYSIDSAQTWQSNNVFSSLSTDTFYIAVQDNNGCIQFGDTIIIQEAEPLIISVMDIMDEYQCPNSSKRDVNQTGLISVEVSGGKGDYQYTWQYGLNPISGDETIHNLSAGTYELTVEDSLGCEKDTTITIGSDASYDLEFSVDIEDTTICWYQPIYFTFNSTNADSIEIQKYRPISSYSYIEITDETMEYDYHITENNYFNLKAFNEYCEEDYITEEFKYFPDRELSIVENDDNENDTIIIKGDNGRWNALAYVNNPNGLDVDWSPNDGVSNPDSLNTIISPAESMWYAVKITTVEGQCSDSDSIYVSYVPDIVTYDGFSPNGDGINDFWYIENINAFKNNIVTVYNRWGTKVYEQKGYNNNDSNKRWDGTAKNGKQVGSGTYYYVIILNEEGFSSVTGAVTIMR